MLWSRMEESAIEPVTFEGIAYKDIPRISSRLYERVAELLRRARQKKVQDCKESNKIFEFGGPPVVNQYLKAHFDGLTAKA